VSTWDTNLRKCAILRIIAEPISPSDLFYPQPPPFKLSRANPSLQSSGNRAASQPKPDIDIQTPKKKKKPLTIPARLNGHTVQSNRSYTRIRISYSEPPKFTSHNICYVKAFLRWTHSLNITCIPYTLNRIDFGGKFLIKKTYRNPPPKKCHIKLPSYVLLRAQTQTTGTGPFGSIDV